tara:strand:- start:2303 stop:3616 length:1314 start_codon:yes stop_codon:yes gene_type:complete
MNNNQNIFLNKKILIYGLGKSGLSAFEFLKNKCDVFLFDDSRLNIHKPNIKKKLLNLRTVLNLRFDKIIISPGIDIKNCKLSDFLKRNSYKIYSDLDIFYEFFKNTCITVTGTNGKSTTCKLLYEILLKQKKNVKLVGNIGFPILSVKNFNKNTIFVIEASSYQLENSKIFKSKYALILNISPDHIERHQTLNKYIAAKFKLLQSQKKGDISFVKKNDLLIKKKIQRDKLFGKIINVDTSQTKKILRHIRNEYFFSDANIENLSFVLAVSKILRLKRNILIKTIQNFKGLKFRQQTIFKNNRLTIINDSKSTSFSSSIGILKTKSNLFWILGGIHKKGDKFKLQKKYLKKIKAFIYGRDKSFFVNELKGKIKFENFKNLNDAFKRVFSQVKKNIGHQTILFSPCAASFDNFKNFEDRGHYFDNLVKKYFYGKKNKNI